MRIKNRHCVLANNNQRVDLLEVLPELREEEDVERLLLDRLPLDRLALRPRTGRRGGEATGFCAQIC